MGLLTHPKINWIAFIEKFFMFHNFIQFRQAGIIKSGPRCWTQNPVRRAARVQIPLPALRSKGAEFQFPLSLKNKDFINF